MKTPTLILIWAAMILGGILALAGLASGGRLLLNKVFAPEFEQVRRETFEQSKAYRDGTLHELRAMQRSYLEADPAHRSGLASIMRHQAAALPDGVLPPDLRNFLKELP